MLDQAILMHCEFEIRNKRMWN